MRHTSPGTTSAGYAPVFVGQLTNYELLDPPEPDLNDDIRDFYTVMSTFRAP